MKRGTIAKRVERLKQKQKKKKKQKSDITEVQMHPLVQTLE